MRFKGSITGASLIAVGTAIGAGMLGIPLIAGSLGFVLTSALLFVCWGVTIIASFVLLHVNMAYPELSNISTMTKNSLGKVGSFLAAVCYALLLYSFIAAYMTGGASLLGRTLVSYFQIHTSSLFNTVIFSAALGIFVYFGTRSVDYINRVLLTLKIGAFFLMVGMLLPHINLESLTPVPSDLGSWVIAVPVLMSAFSYQMVIPNVRDYLHSHVRKIKQAIWIGGTIPLVIYLLWVAVIFGLVPDLTSKDDLATLVSKLESRVKIPVVGMIISFFTDIAVTTSFLGISMSLFHFVRDTFRLNHNRFGEKELAILMTLIPPLLFAWAYPNGFVVALNCAGVFVILLLMLIPLWMARHLKQTKKRSRFRFNLHWSGLLLILIVSIIALGVQIFQFK